MAPRPLRILLTNAFSIYNKIGELQHVLMTLDVDVAIVTETKLTPEKATQAEVTVPGYCPPIRKDRTSHGGGVAIWVKVGLPYKELDIDPANQEIAWINISTTPGNKIGICAAYRPGTCPDNDISMFNQLESNIDAARRSCSSIIVAGDFNVHNTDWLGSTRTTPAGETAEDMCYIHGLQQHVTAPTRGNNILDLVMSDLPGGATAMLHPPLGQSDHAVITVDFQLTPPRDPPTTRTVWRYQHADWPRLRAFLKYADWNSILSSDKDLDTSCDLLTETIHEGMTRFIPSKTLKTRPSDPAWWTPECSAAIARKRAAWRFFCKHRHDPAAKDAYRQACTSSTQYLARAKTIHLQQLKRKLAAGSMQNREWWSAIKQAGGHGRSDTIPVLADPTGQDKIRNKDKAEVLGQHFAAKCRLANDFSCGAENFPPVQQRSANLLTTVHFRPSTVQRTLSALNPSKATGPDAVPARVLKSCSDSLAIPLAKLFTRCFRTGQQPTAWKIANVVPVYKKGSKSNPKNYRPISLLSIISKCMETIINRSLSNFLEKNAILSSRQFGFRSNLGTADLLIALQHEWSRHSAQGGLVRVLAVDIAGAFDKVSHRGLLHKAKQYGIRGHLIDWLHSYLSDRKIRVVLSGQASSVYPISSGVPQGSILGPTLFLLYTNDAEDHLPEEAQLAVYADDTTLYKCITSRNTLANEADTIQQAVDALAHWGETWHIAFEPSKSQALVISHYRAPVAAPPIIFQGTVVPDVTQLKLLGVLFDQQLTFKAHLRQLATRGAQRLGFFRKASRVLTPKGRAIVYKGFVRPVLEYGMLVWMGAASSSLARLSAIQRRALHIIGDGAYLPSLAVRRTVAALCYLYKLHFAEGPEMITNLLPPPAPPPLRHSTRHDHHPPHDFQLSSSLPRHSRNNVLRAFPHNVSNMWNQLPCNLLPAKPSPKGLQPFKEKVYHHLQQANWDWATDRL